MSGSLFLIHSAILCLLIGAFNPFKFNVIIDSTFNVIIDGTFSLLFFRTCVPLCLFFFPCHKADPLASLVELVGGDVFFEASFVWETPYLSFDFN